MAREIDEIESFVCFRVAKLRLEGNGLLQLQTENKIDCRSILKAFINLIDLRNISRYELPNNNSYKHLDVAILRRDHT